MTLPDWLNDGLDRFHEDDTLSWIGHGLQGLAFGFVGGWLGLIGYEGMIFTIGVFGHREFDQAFHTLRTEGLRAARDKVVEDGAMDLIAPYIGGVIGTAVGLIVR